MMAASWFRSVSWLFPLFQLITRKQRTRELIEISETETRTKRELMLLLCGMLLFNETKRALFPFAYLRLFQLNKGHKEAPSGSVSQCSLVLCFSLPRLASFFFPFILCLISMQCNGSENKAKKWKKENEVNEPCLSFLCFVSIKHAFPCFNLTKHTRRKGNTIEQYSTIRVCF